MSVKENLEKIKRDIPKHVTLCAISKTKQAHLIQELFDAGQLDFGENKVQEMVDKQSILPSSIRWHQVGTLQRNKVKYLAPFVHLIHSVDSIKLLAEINKEAEKNNREIAVLLQMHIAKEETKFGLNEAELYGILDSKELQAMNHIRIEGLMGMATFTKDENLISKEFAGLKKLYDRVAIIHNGNERIRMTILSMGMSSDYHLAIDQGSNLVRIGSALFGERN